MQLLELVGAEAAQRLLQDRVQHTAARLTRLLATLDEAVPDRASRAFDAREEAAPVTSPSSRHRRHCWSC